MAALSFVDEELPSSRTMPYMVGIIPRYVCGTGTIVSIAFREDEEGGSDESGDVHVAICARRSTVSSGNFTPRSSVDATKVATLQLLGFRTGSMLRYDFRKRGAEVEINAGSVDVRKVIGTRCVGIRYAGESVPNVASRVRGECDEGVRMSLVLEASTGERTSAAIAADAVAISTDATGEVDVKIDELGIAPVDAGTSMSASATPNVAASMPRKNVSNVRDKRLYMKVVFVARHSDRAPLLDDNDERASKRECVFLSCKRCEDRGSSERVWPFRLLMWCGGRPCRPRLGD